MKPVKVFYSLLVRGETENKIENEYKGIKEENKIEFKEGNIDVILTFLENTIIMNRGTEEYEIEMKFEKEGNYEGIYKVVGIPNMMKLMVKTLFFEKIENKIKIDYTLDLNGENLGIFSLTLEYEVLA